MPNISSTLSTAHVSGQTLPEYTLSFKINGYEFANACTPEIVKSVMDTQLQTYLTFAVGELLKDPAMQDTLKPKIREYMENMTLSEILTMTGANLKDIAWLWEE